MPVRMERLWPLSLPAYHALGEAGLIPENTELLYGLVYRKMPKSPLHTYFLDLLAELTKRVLPEDLHARLEQPISGIDSEPEPDLAVVVGSREQFRHEHPKCAELVMEICISSQDYDRIKLRAYAMAGVKECWLLLVPEKRVEVYRVPQHGEFTQGLQFGPGGTLTSSALPMFTLDLADFYK